MTTTAKDTPTRTDELELAGLLLATLPRLVKMAMSAGERSSVSANRAGVMWQLRERAMRSGELAQRCVMTAPALTEQVDTLERDGFVRRLEDPNDRRVVLVELTAHGRRELDKYREYMKRRIAHVLGGLSPDKRARLRSALADVQEAVEKMTEETASAR
jgi:DNA-binding MarR family transcriptional regulator